MAFQLPDLPYAFDALEPHIDARTMEIHHDKHHAGYTSKLNAAIQGTDLEGKKIKERVKKTTARVLGRSSIMKDSKEEEEEDKSTRGKGKGKNQLPKVDY